MKLKYSLRRSGATGSLPLILGFRAVPAITARENGRRPHRRPAVIVDRLETKTMNLQYQTNTTFDPAAARPVTSPPTRREKFPHQALSGQCIAKSRRGPRELAVLAVLWLRGGLTITRPTVKMASAVFGVSIPLIREMAGEMAIHGTTPRESIDAYWTSMTLAERAAFFRGRVDEVWQALELAISD
jgi:hypothetical protein